MNTSFAEMIHDPARVDFPGAMWAERAVRGPAGDKGPFVKTSGAGRKTCLCDLPGSPNLE
jgi:hypothetical protein